MEDHTASQSQPSADEGPTASLAQAQSFAGKWGCFTLSEKDDAVWERAVRGDATAFRPALSIFQRALRRTATDRCDGALLHLANSLGDLLWVSPKGGA